MRRWKMIAPLLLVSTPLLSAVSLTVNVQDETTTSLDGATVYALVFTASGPDPVNSRVDTTVEGQVTLSLADGLHYEIFATRDGYTPTLRQTFESPDPALHHHVLASGTPAPVTITLHSSGTVRGTVFATVTHAPHNQMIFGQVFRPAGPEDVAMGACLTNGAGDCTLTFVNVPPASANSYRIGAHDPTHNVGSEAKVTHALTYGGAVGPYTLNLDPTVAIPPETVERRGGPVVSGDPSLQGVVVTTNNVPVPHVGVNYTPPDGPGFWTQTDQNGRFTLYGMTPGTTYYAQVHSGCNESGCFEGYNSPDATSRGATVGPKDILFDAASAPMKVRLPLQASAPGSGEIHVYVKTPEGDSLPGGEINVWPDGSNWNMDPAEGCADPGAVKMSRPGLANVHATAETGHALITGLPPGNYTINVWSPFSSGNAQYNAGPDGDFNWQWDADCGSGTRADDLRVTISTAAPTFAVYDAQGNDLGLSSVTVVMNGLAGTANAVAALRLDFPTTVDLSENPILVSLKNCGDGGCRGNFHQFGGSGSSMTFDLEIASGTYFVDVFTKYWGIVREGGGQNQVILGDGATVPVRFKFAKAGRATGILYKPDGTIYTPAPGEWASVNAHGKNVESWGWSNISKEGRFTIGGLLPGTYELQVNGGGNFDLASPVEPVRVVVTADNDSYAEIRTVNGTRVQPSVNFAAWEPPFSVEDGGENGESPLAAYFFPAGTKMNGAKIIELMNSNELPNRLIYQAPGNEGPCGGSDWPGGFCIEPAESPKAYDFYLFHRTEFRPGGTSYSQMTPLSSAKNIVVNDENATASAWINMSTVTFVPVDLTPPEGEHQGTAILSGDVTADNIFRQNDFEALGGNFENFIRFIPVLSLYRASGDLAAVAMVTPRPSEFNPGHDVILNEALATGNWTAFKTLFDSFHFSYRIQGLDANTPYIAVLTTPNYPPYKVGIETGANASTTTLHFPLDTVVSAGVTLSGTVRASGGAALPNASVTVKSPGIETKNLTTNSDGQYSLPALGKGAYRVTFSAADYAPAVKELNITADEGTQTLDVSLTAGAGIIRGSVYKRRFPSPQALVGATVVAYNDTQNGEHPTEPVYLHSAQTGADGTYELSGLVVGDAYRVSLAVPGKYVLSETTVTTVSAIEGIDFTLQTKALDVEVSVKKRTNDFEVIINNPSDFSGGEVRFSLDPYDVGASTDITSVFTQLPNNQLVAHIPFAGLSSSSDYVIHIEAESFAGETVVKEAPFSMRDNGYADKQIDLALLGDETINSQGRAANEVLLDESGQDPSGLVIPTGGLVTSTGTVAEVPSMTFGKTDRENADGELTDSLPDGAELSSDVYTLGLDNVNLTEKGFDLTLGFDPEADWSELAAYQYNPTTGEWDLVPGVQTIDPTAGTIQFNVTDLTGSSPGAPRRGSPRSARVAGSMRAAFNGKIHQIRIHATSGSGQFAVMKVASVAGTAFSGTKFKVFNFPNPFNLDAKTVSIANGGSTSSLTTSGTVIRYEVPPSVETGRVVIRIYSLSGELVREIDEGDRDGGYYYYTAWDGKNRDDNTVANGVYYGVVSMPGVSVKDARFKLAVVK